MGNRTAFRYGALPEGALLAGYRIEEQIGQGGMAVVYRAYDRRLDRCVALKVLSAAAAADIDFRRRFIRESRAAAAVDHPHIIPIHDAGEADGVLFIAMRYVERGDLSALLGRRGPLPPERVCGIVAQVASALDAAHARGLVHRDVKPANILLDAGTSAERPDHAYLTDFGVTNASRRAGGTDSHTDPSHMAEFVGTPRYVAPEQIHGRKVDGRADEYALACTAYHMLAGAPPFSGGNHSTALWAHLYEPAPPLTTRRPGLPATVDRVFAIALAKPPRGRYRTCLDFAGALRSAFGQGTGPRRAAGHPGAPPPAGPYPEPGNNAPLRYPSPPDGRGRAKAGRDPKRASAGKPQGGPFQYALVAVLAMLAVVAITVARSVLGGRAGTHHANPPAARQVGTVPVYQGGDAGPGCPAAPAATAAAERAAGGDGWIEVGGGPAACHGGALATRRSGQVTAVQDTFTWTFRIGHPATCSVSVFIADVNPSSGVARYEVFGTGRIPVGQFDLLQGQAKGTWVSAGPWHIPAATLQLVLTDRAAFPGDTNHVTASAARATCH